MGALLLVLLGLIGTVFGQDCSRLLGARNARKRFILDTVSGYYTKLPREVRDVLPPNTEVDSKCRFDLTSLTDGEKQTLKTLYNQNYTLCVGCGYTNSDFGRCHSVDVCQKGSVCIRAKNSDTRQGVPLYQWHGCCNPSNRECKQRVEQITFNLGFYNPVMRYPKDTCIGPICNEEGYTAEKDDLINFVMTAPTSASVIDGNWSEWGAWGACDRSCNFGVHTKVRTCTSPAPQNGGMDCSGFSRQTDLCNDFPCQ